MKRKWRLLIILGAILLTLVVLALVVIYVVSPLVLLENEDIYLKDKLNNPYINDSFAGWETYDTVVPGRAFKLPEGWDLTSEGTGYILKDHEGKLLAYGGIVSDEGTGFTSSRAMYQTYVSFEIEETDITYDTEYISIGGSSFFKATHLGKEAEESHYVLYLEDRADTSFYLLFPQDCGIDLPELKEIAQAITYSYSFS